jgi:hypothetical protein
MMLVVVVALAVPVAALAATLETGKFGEYITEGDKCANGAYYHIVHPGPYGGAAGTVTVEFLSPDETKIEHSYATHGKTTHYLVFSTGRLDSASDDIAEGKLVISGYRCK